METTIWGSISPDDISQGIAKNQFFMVYQPIWNLQSGNLYGYEALARWNRDGNFISPELFISIACAAYEFDPSLQKGELSRHLLTLACADWLRAGMGHLWLHFNLTIYDMRDRWLMTQLAQRQGFVVAEVTEQEIDFDNPLTRNQFAYLRSNRIPVAIDDFGRGYHSVATMLNAEGNLIKLDKHITDKVGTVRGRDLAQYLIYYAHRFLGALVVAEGIETQEQLDIYRAIGCDLGQGYFHKLGKPAPLPSSSISE